MKTTTRRLPPSSGRTHVEERAVETFARKLHDLMTTRGMSQSDLARAIWGTRKDPRGYEVARNRDRVSQYLRGASVPDPANMRKLADALGTTVEELAPDVTVDTISRERPEIAMTAVHGHSDKVHLQLNVLLPLTVAVQIVSLVDQAAGGAQAKKGPA